jgi:phosphatidylinositol 4-phosphatase
LQHKQELIAKAKKQTELLDELLPPKNEDKKNKDKSKDKHQSHTKSKDKDKPSSPTKSAESLSPTKVSDKHDSPITHAAGYIREGDKVDPLAEPNPTLPLWRRVDKQFWWNEWLSKPLIDAGLHSYILPLMQGYYQFAQFTLPPDELTHPTALTVDYILISRRSKDRAGLRYQRRGADDEANVANFVESEMIMSVERGDAEGKNVFGYVQVRGSSELFFVSSSSVVQL